MTAICAGQWSYAISERLTDAPICQLCQMTALSPGRRWVMRAQSPAGARPPWRSRPDRRPTTTDEIGAVVPSNRATTDLDPASGGTVSTAAGQDQTQPQPKGNREDEAH